MTTVFSFFVIFLIIIGIIAIFSIFFTVEQQSIAILEIFGKFSRIAKPGLNVKIPFIERVSGKVNLRIQQLDVNVETKTKDNVFVNVIVSVQYYVLDDRVYEAFYKLSNPEKQLTSFVFDVVRSTVPQIILDDVFEKKDDIANAVKSELGNLMDDFGYAIVKALVTDIDPNAKVKEAMNEINAAQRLKVAATEKGEAEKILKVKEAEADARSKALSGEGIANQRKAIILGLQESVDEFQKSIPGSTAGDVMNLVLMTQYFDTLKDIGNSSKSNTILIPHSPGTLTDLSSQISQTIITANEVSRVPRE
jgi:regulator of protease activity HflC (stomatin/prohibitin superfamily)